MDLIIQWVKGCWHWVGEGEHLDKLFLALLVALIVSLLTWFRQVVARGFSSLVSRWTRRSRYSVHLQRYRQALDQEALEVHHAWMKEGQTFSAILMPVPIETGKEKGDIDDLPVVLAESFRAQQGSPRIVILGGPGAGKSIGLRVAARLCWSFKDPDGEALVPVLITFSDLRRAEFDLPRAVVASLRERSFQPRSGPDGGKSASRFVAENLANGRIVALIDALDELKAADRVLALQRLRAVTKEYRRIPLLLTCRTAAWRGQLPDVVQSVFHVADFGSQAQMRFLRSWDFPPPKSAGELHGIITSQPHIGTLARNPLLLTIIAYLYSQPRYRLPENRALFYEVCTRALLEEWDQAANPDRANQFDRIIKESLLGQLAYAQLAGATPDDDIEENDAIAVFARGMSKAGLIVSAGSLLEEIIVNSGLLFRLPPSGLRFPHKTFLEFFAALHLLHQETPRAVLDLYWADKDRWREVLLLYCGLNADRAQGTAVLREVMQRDSLEFVVACLLDSRTADAAAIEEIMALCEAALREHPRAELVNPLGLFAANPLSAYAGQARGWLKTLLQECLAQPSTERSALIEALLVALMRRPDEAIVSVVLANLDHLNASRLLPSLGEELVASTPKVMRQDDVTIEKKVEWIDGLRRAGAIRALLDLLAAKPGDGELERAASVALARLSVGNQEFWRSLDEGEEPAGLPSAAAKEIERRWTWPFALPASALGTRRVYRIADRLQEAVAEAEVDPIHLTPREINARFLYLAYGIARERHSASAWRGEFVEELRATPLLVMRSIWRKARNSRWLRWAETEPYAWAVVLTVAIPNAWSLIASAAYLWRGRSLGMRRPYMFLILNLTAGSVLLLLRQLRKKHVDYIESTGDAVLGAFFVFPLSIPILTFGKSRADTMQFLLLWLAPLAFLIGLEWGNLFGYFLVTQLFAAFFSFAELTNRTLPPICPTSNTCSLLKVLIDPETQPKK